MKNMLELGKTALQRMKFTSCLIFYVFFSLLVFSFAHRTQSPKIAVLLILFQMDALTLLDEQILFSDATKVAGCGVRKKNENVVRILIQRWK